MNTEEQKKRDHYPVSPKDLLDFASRMAYISQRFKSISEAMDSAGINPLQATGKPTAERGEKFLVAWLKSLQGALDKAAMKSSGDSDEAERCRCIPDFSSKSLLLEDIKDRASVGVGPFFVFFLPHEGVNHGPPLSRRVRKR